MCICYYFIDVYIHKDEELFGKIFAYFLYDEYKKNIDIRKCLTEHIIQNFTTYSVTGSPIFFIRN